MPFSDYIKVKEIGSGSFGRAYLVERAVDKVNQGQKKQLVMKEIDNPKKEAEVEVKVLSALKHPYIVRYWESFMNKHKLCIVMDYCESGDMSKLVTTCKRKNSPLQETQIVRWFTQMNLALKYIHQSNILHRDIKTQNVFLAKKEGGVVGGDPRCAILADFGIAKVLNAEGAKARTQVGTPYYISPEICKNQPYAGGSDMWSMGCLLYELCALRVPFDAQSMEGLMDKILRTPAPNIPKTYGADLSKLSHDLLEKNASKRPSAADVLQRPNIQAEIKKMLAESQARKERGGAPEGAMRREPSGHREPSPACPSPALKRDPSREGALKREPSREGALKRDPSPRRDLGAVPTPGRNRGRDPSPQRVVGQEIVRPRDPSPAPRPR